MKKFLSVFFAFVMIIVLLAPSDDAQAKKKTTAVEEISSETVENEDTSKDAAPSDAAETSTDTSDTKDSVAVDEEPSDIGASEEAAEAPEETVVETTAEEPEVVVTPEISQTRARLKPGQKLKLTVTGNKGKIEWISMNPAVATVSKKGKVTAVAEGTTRIFAKVDGLKLKCIVKVEAEKSVSIVAVGDNLYHTKVTDSGLKSDGSYNFDYIYSNISKYIKAADVGIVNQETILTADKELWTVYKTFTFGTPLEAGAALVNAGFNVITCASNHSYDRGEAGILSTVAFWRTQAEKGVLTTGMYDNQADYNKITVGEYNGIKIAFLNYTYGLNGYKLPSNKQYFVKLINETLMKNEIAKAKKLADVVIVLPHWGTEYKLEADDSQKALAQKLADWGADIIIGTHPHVLEPLEFYTATDGRVVPCYYSLGDFVANMPNDYKQLGGMAEIKITKWNGKITIESAELTPLVIHIEGNPKKYSIYKLTDYTNALGKRHSEQLTTEYLWSLYNQITGK